MKKIKIQILCTIVLLGNAASLHCMFSSLRSKASAMSRRPATSGMSREAAARLVAARKAERSSLEVSNASPIRDTSTWSGWFKSKTDWFKTLFQRSSVQSQGSQHPSYASVRTVPFGARGFSTTTTQRAPLWDTITSYFEEKSQERFAEQFDKLLNGTITKENERSFTAKDLESAKQFIDKNEKFINIAIKSHYYIGEGQTLPRGIRIIKYDQPIFSENSLDMVMRHLFPYINKDFSDLNRDYYGYNLDVIKNYLDLALYIANMGVELRKKQIYQDVYFTKLMPAYKFLHSVNPSDRRYSLFGSTEQAYLKNMREIFTKLDPLLEKLIPGIEKYIRDAQEERAKIDSDPTAYRQRLQDEEDRRYPEKKAAREKANREEYLKSKRKRKEILWRYANNRWDMDEDYRISKATREQWANVDFIEDEYKEWLKDPIGFINFHYGASSSYQSAADAQRQKQQQREQQKSKEQEEVLRYKGEAIWDLLPGLTANSSKEEIAKKFREFMLEYHPDRLPKYTTDDAKEIGDLYRKFMLEYHPDKPLKDTADDKKEEIEAEVRKITAAWDEYSDQLKKQQAAK